MKNLLKRILADIREKAAVYRAFLWILIMSIGGIIIYYWPEYYGLGLGITVLGMAGFVSEFYRALK